MSRAELPALVGGPYRQPPRRDCRIGAVVGDLAFGEVTVIALADLPIGPWPVHRRGNGFRMPVVTRSLGQAIRTESRLAVAAWWHVSESTAWMWRHALGVGRWTPGTLSLWRELAPQRLTHEARVRGARAPKPRPRVRIPDRETARRIVQLGRIWGEDTPLSEGRVIAEAIRRAFESESFRSGKLGNMDKPAGSE